MKPACLAAGMMLLAGCSPSTPPKPATEAPIAKHAAPADESRKLPSANRTSSELVADHMFGRDWLPGGTVGHYKQGAKQWDLILMKSDAPATAATWLLDYKNQLGGATLVPSFGGFFGTDKGRPVFIFTKGVWLAAVAGLPQADADLIARDFAARLKAD